MSKNRDKRRREAAKAREKGWVRGTREQVLKGIIGSKPKEESKVIEPTKPPEPPGAKVEAPATAQQMLDVDEGHAEDKPIPANGVRQVEYSPHVRTKDCLKAFNEGIKKIEEEHKGKFLQQFNEPRVLGRYKPRVRFYLSPEAAEGKKPEEVAVLERAGREAIFALIAALCERYDGEFRQVMVAAPLEQDGSGAGEYMAQIQFTAH